MIRSPARDSTPSSYAPIYNTFDLEPRLICRPTLRLFRGLGLRGLGERLPSGLNETSCLATLWPRLNLSVPFG